MNSGVSRDSVFAVSFPEDDAILKIEIQDRPTESSIRQGQNRVITQPEAKDEDVTKEFAAPCLGLTKLFYSPPSDGPKETNIERELRERKAKAICAGCLITEECLAGAKQRREQWGIWGGQTEEERGVKRRR